MPDAAIANPNPTIVETAQPPALPNGSQQPPANGAITVPDWAKDFDDDTKALISKKQWKDRADIGRAYQSLERLAYADGQQKVLLPDANTPEAERNAFYLRLGKPETAEGYQFKAPQDAKNYSDDMAGWFRAAAHKHHLSREAAEALHDEYVGHFLEQNKARDAEETAQKGEWDRILHQEFGKAYDGRVEMARRAVRTFGDQEFIDLLNNSGLGDHPAVVRFASKIGLKFGEQNLVTGSEGSNAEMTPAEAHEKIMAMNRDTKHPYWVGSHPDHMAAVKERERLYAAAYPSGGQ